MKLWPFNIPAKSSPEIRTATMGHSGASTDRNSGSWNATHTDLDRYLKKDLKNLQKNSVGLEMDDGYAREILGEIVTNVIGEEGIRVEPRPRKRDARLPGGISTEIDKPLAEIIALAWNDFSKKKNFSVDRRFSRRRYEQQAIRQVARLGGQLHRLIPGYSDNAFRFAVQPIAITNLDPRYSDARKNIHMGVEFGEWDRRVAYHVDVQPPKGKSQLGRRTMDRERLPAETALHLFLADDPDQTQGKPWLAASMRRLKQLGMLEEAELVASIEHANNHTYIEQNEYGEWTGETDKQGNPIQPSEPGSTTYLNQGQKANLVQPTHPNSAFADARKAFLRGICAGVFANYNVIGRDLEGVSFSSIRQGVLSERESYKLIQCWFIDDFEIPVFEMWLEQQLLAGTFGPSLGLLDLPRISHAFIEGRAWDWVDPLKDINAAAKEVALNVQSRGGVARKMGRNYSEIAKENEEQQKGLVKAGLMADPNKPPAKEERRM